MHPSYGNGLGKGKHTQRRGNTRTDLRRACVRDDLIGMHEAQRVSNYSQLQSIIMGLVMLSLSVSH